MVITHLYLLGEINNRLEDYIMQTYKFAKKQPKY